MVREGRAMGPLTEGQQFIVDKAEAMDALQRVGVPEQCESCWPHLKLVVLGRIGTRVANGEITIDQGKLEAFQYSADCTGTLVDTTRHDADPICPKKEEENRRPTCW